MDPVTMALVALAVSAGINFGTEHLFGQGSASDKNKRALKNTAMDAPFALAGAPGASGGFKSAATAGAKAGARQTLGRKAGVGGMNQGAFNNMMGGDVNSGQDIMGLMQLAQQFLQPQQQAPVQMNPVQFPQPQISGLGMQGSGDVNTLLNLMAMSQRGGRLM